MLNRLLRVPAVARATPVRRLNVPFQDDLTPADDELFNLEGFREYKESPEVRAYRKSLGFVEGEEEEQKGGRPVEPTEIGTSLASVAQKPSPLVFVSKLTNPYLNLAIEDYVYHKMPVPGAGEANCNRLMFYVNTPCVVIGKNQNPWREVNMPLLNSLRLPLVRRRSGGGTVVHDTGNVNYSFMTTKERFDRKAFASVVCESVNEIAVPEKQIMVTERGDIVTINDQLKVSGSAYKLTKGRSYHHGTMLLDSKLDVLRQLLHRDESEVGTIESTASVASVKSPVTNLHLKKEDFIETVSAGFRNAYGTVKESSEEKEPEDMNENEFLGLQDFVNAFSERECETFVVDENTELPQEIEDMKNELTSWEWKFGSTAKFTHRFVHPKKDLKVEFDVVKGKLGGLRVQGDEHTKEAVEFLEMMLQRGDGVPYTGSDVAGFITDDELSEWIGNAIDGSS
ncbi:hypothetical protein FT663_04760 [Candidozyma haemuli var. vulneris]|uniref:Putative lipoate-protein ligase A n=1 Tax=Candidozyma haemuli TaxID=45357 RepID=A0A2V1B0A3_9ASCO|nr:hypothetical protein CXQ85_003868 [[Candida] haemuloni]KAF3986723.1 hypothetical protein FT663_04760 [[Candida] haemuloni var. vulneris]KAF3987853.1 hypothetical protein FT662_03744 [[Candida] haemuloni var. vulneris]PVH23578.1 hypothetical protein CXQ85_003868 [[Candida] haemuloni]